MGRDQVDRFAVHSTLQADSERPGRVAQRPRPRRTAHCPHVSRYPGRSSTGRVLETGLQRDPPAFFARLSNPEGVRPNLFNHPTLTVMTCAKATSRQGGTLVG